MSNLYKTVRTLTSSEILNLGTTAINLIGAPGANKYIHLVTGMAKLDYNSVAYNGLNNMAIVHAGASNSIYEISNLFYAQTTDDITMLRGIQHNPLTAQIVVNSGIEATIAVSPTLGNSTLTIHLSYLILNTSNIP